MARLLYIVGVVVVVSFNLVLVVGFMPREKRQIYLVKSGVGW
jgi:hypothetical protein